MKLITFFLKKLNFYFLLVLVLYSYSGFSQSAGDIAFTAFNADGDDDFAIVILADISASTTIYFTDNEPGDSSSTLADTNEGIFSWNTGGSTISAGTIVVFTDCDSGSRSVSTGSLSAEGGSFNLSAGGDALYAYTGSSSTNITTWLAGIQNEANNEGSGFSNTGLTAGTTFINFYSSGNPDGGYYSGSRTGQSSFSGYLTLLGDNSNWSVETSNGEAILPISTTVFSIDLTVSSNTTISTSKTFDNITVDADVTLTIAKEGDVTVNTSITNNGTIVLNSDSNEFAVLISKASSTTITYNRYVNVVGTDNWDLIGSSVAGQTFSGFVTANSSTLATNGSGPVEYAIGVYDNSDDTWDNYDANTVSSNTFDIGTGYAMASVSGGVEGTAGLLAFTGTTAIVDQTQAIINNASSGRRWNLIANPFPSFINANDDTHATNNFLTVNVNNIDSEYLAVYGYDGDGVGTEYTAYGHDYEGSDTPVYIAPGQGFMVASDNTSVGDAASFTEAMQSVSGSDDFIDGISGDAMDPVNTLLLRLYHGDQEIEGIRIKFKENMTTGLDPGYDLGSFYQNAAIMTRLLEEDQGTGFQDQQLPLSLMDDVVIPLEINQTAGQEFRINLHTSTIGEVNIYLEDTELQTLTLLNEEDFVMTPTYDLSDAGRFFIHTTEDTLSDGEVNTSLLNAYKEVNANYITIEGLATQATSTEVSLYNILGTKVMDTTLDNTTNTQTISTNGFSTGIYVLKLISGKNQLTKKLIIK